MRIVHKSAEPLKVALFKKRGTLENALILADRVDCTLRLSLIETFAVEDPLCRGDVAQVRNRLAQDLCEMLCGIFTGLTTGSIRAINKSMLGVGLHHHERHGRSEIHVLEGAVAEIALYETASLAKKGGSLIEKSARAAGEGMFCLLADLCEVDTVLPDTVDLAERNPSCNYIGVDIKGARLWKGAKYAEEHGLKNVAFLRTRIEFIESLFAPGEVSEIWITFADPQIGREKKRLTAPLFMNRYRNFLKEGGIVHLKTDSRYLHEYSRAMAEQNELKILACGTDIYGADREGLYASELSSVRGRAAVDALFEVQTFYESQYLAQGFEITYTSWDSWKEEFPVSERLEVIYQ